MKDEFIQSDSNVWISSRDIDVNNIVYKNKYFCITKVIQYKRKTPIYYIWTFNNVCIGEIKWYAPWRKFCFHPYDETVWSNDCLLCVIDFITTINNEYYNK